MGARAGFFAFERYNSSAPPPRIAPGGNYTKFPRVAFNPAPLLGLWCRFEAPQIDYA
jgi:hypothetical protein